MKKAAYGFGGLVVLLVAAVLIVPSLVDWNSYKAEIAAEHVELEVEADERLVGREVGELRDRRQLLSARADDDMHVRKIGGDDLAGALLEDGAE